MASAAEAVRPTAPLDAGYRRVLVPVSGSAGDARAMEAACALAAEHGVAITVVCAIEVSPLLPLDARMTDEEATAREAFVRAEAIADAFGLKIRTEMVRTRDAGRAIVELVEDENVELVVVDAPRTRRIYGRGPALGRTVRHVLAKAPCRVLIVAEKEENQ